MDSNILYTKNLSIGYSSKKEISVVANEIDINLSKGNLIAIIGANGVGKSTLLRTITGLQKPLSGDVYLDGRNIFEYHSRELAQKLSVVLTEKLPPSNLTVYEIVALGRQPYTDWLGKLSKEDLSKIDDAITITQIGALAAKKFHEISDGQLQTVMVARALAQDTPLIILDEPTTHLDLLHKAALFRLLKKLAKDVGKCILFSTHDIDMAIELSDEIIVMTHQHVNQATPNELIANNRFDSLFPTDQIAFDKTKGKFVFKNL